MSGEDRRHQLLEIAIDLFSKKGFAGTTTREIAAAAGVTEAIIFRHFATKQDLYAAILDYENSTHGLDKWFAEAEVFMEAQDDEGLFRLIVTKILEMHRSEPRFERLMVYAALEGHEIAVMHHNQMTREVGLRIKEYIAQRQKDGVLYPTDPSTILCSVAGVAQFYAMQKYMYHLGEDKFSDEQMIDDFVRILMCGVRSNQC